MVTLMLTAALAIVGDSTKSPIVAPAYQMAQLALPSATRPTGLAVSREGLALVAVDGGVAVAGLGGWLVEPRQAAIVAVATGQDGAVIALRRWRDGRLRLIQERRNGTDTLAALPDGSYQIAAAGPAAGWAWGRSRAGRWSIWHCEAGQAVEVLGSFDTPLTALSPLGQGSAVAAAGPSLVILRRGSSPVRLATLQYPAAGLATAPDGSLLIASVAGVFRLTAKGELRALALGLSGPLQVLGPTVFVLDRHRNRVFRLTPMP